MRAHPNPDKLGAAISEVKGKFDAVDAARKSEDAATTTMTAKRGALEKLGAKTSKLETTYGSQRATLSPLSGRRLAPMPDCSWTGKRSPSGPPPLPMSRRIRDQGGGCSRRAPADGADPDPGADRRVCRTELDVSGTVVEALTALAEAGANAEAESRRITHAMAEAKEKSAQVKGLDRQAEVASELRGLLEVEPFPQLGWSPKPWSSWY